MDWLSRVFTFIEKCGNCRISITLTLTIILQALSIGCHREETTTKKCEDSLTAAESLDQAACDFDIYWPPRDPQDRKPASKNPLLRGTLDIETKQAAADGDELRLVVTLTRPSEEADRRFWNSELAFADIAWMSQVRVWDAEKKWLWPNLPYLLRLPGRERVERYGGMDPGKHVDNDFAAVLIRKYDAAGKTESPDTKQSPLVSSQWYPEPMANTDGNTVVHTAKSDTFVLHLGGENQTARGRIKVWLIYADFFGARIPRTWPKAREWAGGILAYFEIDWETSPGKACRGIVRHTRPEKSTLFDWDEWVERAPGSDESKAQVRLSDVGGGAGS